MRQQTLAFIALFFAVFLGHPQTSEISLITAASANSGPDSVASPKWSIAPQGVEIRDGTIEILVGQLVELRLTQAGLNEEELDSLRNKASWELKEEGTILEVNPGKNKGFKGDGQIKGLNPGSAVVKAIVKTPSGQNEVVPLKVMVSANTQLTLLRSPNAVPVTRERPLLIEEGSLGEEVQVGFPGNSKKFDIKQLSIEGEGSLKPLLRFRKKEDSSFEAKLNTFALGEVFVIQAVSDPTLTFPLTGTVRIGESGETSNSNSSGRILASVPITIFRPRLEIAPRRLSLKVGQSASVMARVKTDVPDAVPGGQVFWESEDNEVVPAPATEKPTKRFVIQPVKSSSGDVMLKATYRALANGPVQNQSQAELLVAARPRPTKVVFEGENAVLLGRTEEMRISLRDEEMGEIEARDQANFTVRSSHPSILSVRRSATDSKIVRLTGHAQGVVSLIVKVDDTEIDRMTVRVVTVADFRPVRVALNIMDDNTAADLFGSRTSEDFYAVRVRLFNNLDNTFVGQSILAYSESIEAAVGLQKRLIKDRKKGDWMNVEPNDEEIVAPFLPALANLDNPFPFGLSHASASDASSATSLLSEATAPTHLAHKVLQLQPDQNLTFVPPAEVKPLPGSDVEWWSDNPDLVDIDARTGKASIKNPAPSKSPTTVVHLTFAGKRFARVVTVTPASALASNGTPNPETWRVESVFPVTLLEIGNRLNISSAPSQTEGLAGNSKKPEELLRWKFLEGAGPRGDLIADLLHENSKTLVQGRRDGTVAFVGATDRGELHSGTVIFIVPRGGELKLPPSVYLNRDGKLSYLRHLFRYRPYTFEMMLNSSGPRNDRSSRSKAFRALDGLISTTTFAATLGNQKSSTLGALSTFGNLLVPAGQALFPDARDTQRQNFVSMSMKPIEEIPFGSDISRVVFFPKKTFTGFIPDHQTRISRIDTSYFNITVAILNKQQTATVQTGSNGDGGNN